MGTWLTADSSLDDSFYFMLIIEEAGARSFRYELVHRSVPYGPNAERFRGVAEYVSPTEAVDREEGRTLQLEPGRQNARTGVIEHGGESYYLAPTNTGPIGGFRRIGRAEPVAGGGDVLEGLGGGCRCRAPRGDR